MVWLVVFVAALVVAVVVAVGSRSGSAGMPVDPAPAPANAAEIPAPPATCAGLERQLALSEAAGPDSADLPATDLAAVPDLPVAATGADRIFDLGLEWFDTDRPDAALRMTLLEEWGFRELAVREIETDERFDLLVVQVQAFEDRRGAMAWHAWALRQVCDDLPSRTFRELPEGFGLKWRTAERWTEQIAFVRGPYRVLVHADTGEGRQPRDWFLREPATVVHQHIATLLEDVEVAS